MINLNQLYGKGNIEIIDLFNQNKLNDGKIFSSIHDQIDGDQEGILKDKALIALLDILEVEEIYNNKGDLFLVQDSKYYATKTISKFGKLYYDFATLNEVPFHSLNLNLYSKITFEKLNPIQAKFLADYSNSRGLKYKHEFLKK